MKKQDKHNGRISQSADKYGRVVQVAAIIGFVVMVAIDQLGGNMTKIDPWLYGGMLGIAIGAKPEDFSKFLGGKK